MKFITNMTTSYFDLPRYESNDDLKAFYTNSGLDGIELMFAGEDEKKIVMPDDIIGMHLMYFNDWLSVWKEDREAVLAEYGTLETAEGIFGGLKPQNIIDSFRKNISRAKEYDPEYAVFHVSNATLSQSITNTSLLSDAEVTDAAADLINEIFSDGDEQFALLLENLWWSGLTMTDPELCLSFLEKVKYSDKGIMLDIGHLMHTNTKLRSLDEAEDYILEVLERYDSLDFIRGVHLHQSLSGEYVEKIMAEGIDLQGDYYSRYLSLHSHIIEVDNHKPFVSPRINEIIKKIDPQYLVFELITSGRTEHEEYIKAQMDCFRQ